MPTVLPSHARGAYHRIVRSPHWLLLVVLGLSSVAAADDKKDAAAHAQAGKKHLDKKDWLAARKELLAALELVEDPVTRYHLGRAHEGLGEDDKAAAAYDAALAGKLPADLAKDATARAAALRKKPVKVTLESTPEGAAVRVDGTEIAQKTPFFLHLPPGPHKFVFVLPGKPEIVRDEVLAPLAAASVRVDFEPKPLAKPEPKTEPKPEPKPEAKPMPAPEGNAQPAPGPTPTAATSPGGGAGRFLGVETRVWVAGTAAAGFLAFSAIYGVKTLIDRSRYDERPTLERRDLGKRDALVADVSLAIGVGLGALAVVWWATAEPAPKAGAARVTPWVAPTLVGAGATFAF